MAVVPTLTASNLLTKGNATDAMIDSLEVAITLQSSTVDAI